MKIIAKTIILPTLLSLSDIENPFILTPQLSHIQLVNANTLGK